VALIYAASGMLAGAPHPPPPPLHVHHPRWRPPVAAHPVVVPAVRPVVVRRVPVTTVVKTVQELPVVPEVPAEDTANEKAYKVIGVGRDLTVALDMDGKKTPVRLLGLAIPEGPEGETKDALPPISTRALRNLLQGEFVYIAYDENLAPKDANGVMVAYLYRAPERLFVNLEVVRQGLAVTADAYSFENEKLFRGYQQQAQVEDRGIWALIKSPDEKKPAAKPAVPAP
jgi:endonuclease YncB( thermonuclease family)